MRYQQLAGSFVMDEPEVVATPVVVHTVAPAQVVGFMTVDAPVVDRVPQQPVVEAVSANHLISNTEESIGWEGVRDYVVAGITNRWGPFPRNPVTEASIFKSFAKRWDDKALRIAKVAVEQYGCVWAGAPISLNRFTVNSDPFFAAVIAEKIE